MSDFLWYEDEVSPVEKAQKTARAVEAVRSELTDRGIFAFVMNADSLPEAEQRLAMREVNATIDEVVSRYMPEDEGAKARLVSNIFKQFESKIKKAAADPSCTRCSGTGTLSDGSHCTCTAPAYNDSGLKNAAKDEEPEFLKDEEDSDDDEDDEDSDDEDDEDEDEDEDSDDEDGDDDKDDKPKKESRVAADSGPDLGDNLDDAEFNPLDGYSFDLTREEELEPEEESDGSFDDEEYYDDDDADDDNYDDYGPDGFRDDYEPMHPIGRKVIAEGPESPSTGDDEAAARKAAQKAELYDMVTAALPNLEGVEKEVVSRRFHPEQPQSLTEVGKALNLSRLEVRQIELGVIHRLRKSPRTAADAGSNTEKCPECGRQFDLSKREDAEEWYYGHDCES